MDPLAVVTRRDIIESIHYGILCVVHASGEVLFNIGDVSSKIFLRSSAKPLQALALVHSGAAQSYGLTPRELAIICASHHGEQAHRDTVSGILAKAGISPSALRCGCAQPYCEQEQTRLLREGLSPSVLHCCCSGKHAGMLALAKFRGYGLHGYENICHPVQQEILRTVADIMGEDFNTIPTAVDGCGAPVYLSSVYAAALGYASLAQASQDAAHPYHRACKAVFEAMAGFPEMVAGEGAFDTEMMREARGGIIGKSGREGVYCLALRHSALGICIKIADGSERALVPVVMQALQDLNALDNAQYNHLSGFTRMAQKNNHGNTVGWLLPYFRLAAGSFDADPLGKTMQAK
jgi:L-asparaginase II